MGVVRFSLLVGLAGALLDGRQGLSVKRRRPTRCQARMADDQLPEVKPGEIDWDGEWQKVMRGEQDGVSRPKELTLELERAKRRAVRNTERMIESTRAGANRLPKTDFLRQDAQFYLGIIAVLSVIPAILVALTTTSSQYPDPSFIV